MKISPLIIAGGLVAVGGYLMLTDNTDVPMGFLGGGGISSTEPSGSAEQSTINFSFPEANNPFGESSNVGMLSSEPKDTDGVSSDNALSYTQEDFERDIYSAPTKKTVTTADSTGKTRQSISPYTPRATNRINEIFREANAPKKSAKPTYFKTRKEIVRDVISSTNAQPITSKKDLKDDEVTSPVIMEKTKKEASA